MADWNNLIAVKTPNLICHMHFVNAVLIDSFRPKLFEFYIMLDVLITCHY
jgi:hypothetical protein